MSIRRLKCINIHFIHNIQNRHQDDEFSLGIETLDTLYARIIIHNLTRLRVVSNFGDRLWGGRNTRARAKPRNFARARVFRPPHKRSPKLETTRSL